MTTIFNQALTSSFVASVPFIVTANKVVLDFEAVVTVAAKIDWYFEYSEDNVKWFQEVAEENAGNGVVAMPKVIRSFEENGGANLAIGTHFLGTPFERTAKMCRIQARVSTGAASLAVYSEYGALVYSA